MAIYRSVDQAGIEVGRCEMMDDCCVDLVNKANDQKVREGDEELVVVGGGAGGGCRLWKPSRASSHW